MNLLSFLLCSLMVVTHFRTTTAADKILTAESSPIEKGLHRHVVLIVERRLNGTDANYTFLATGNIISPLYILTLEEPLEDKDPKKLVALPGDEIRITDSRLQIIQIDSMKRYKNNSDTSRSELPSQKRCLLLKAAKKMPLGGKMQNAFYGLTNNYNNFSYSHCEIVTWIYREEDDTWRKLLTELTANTIARRYLDFHVISKNPIHSETVIFNPCKHPANVGAAVMCDVALEGLFYGDTQNGCHDPHTGYSIDAFLFFANPDVRDWLRNEMAENSKEWVFDDDYNMRNFDIDNDDEYDENDDNANGKYDKTIFLKRRRCAGAISCREQCVLLYVIIGIVFKLFFSNLE